VDGTDNSLTSRVWLPIVDTSMISSVRVTAGGMLVSSNLGEQLSHSSSSQPTLPHRLDDVLSN